MYTLPLIQELIKDYYSNEIEIIDSATHVAKHIKDKLKDKQLLSQQIARHRFVVSDYTHSLKNLRKSFLEKI